MPRRLRSRTLSALALSALIAGGCEALGGRADAAITRSSLIGEWGHELDGNASAGGASFVELNLAPSGEFQRIEYRDPRRAGGRLDIREFLPRHKGTGWLGPSAAARMEAIDSLQGVWEVKDLEDGTSLCLMAYRSGSIECAPVERITMTDPAYDPPASVSVLRFQGVTWSRIYRE